MLEYEWRDWMPLNDMIAHICRVERCSREAAMNAATHVLRHARVDSKMAGGYPNYLIAETEWGHATIYDDGSVSFIEPWRDHIEVRREQVYLIWPERKFRASPLSPVCRNLPPTDSATVKQESRRVATQVVVPERPRGAAPKSTTRRPGPMEHLISSAIDELWPEGFPLTGRARDRDAKVFQWLEDKGHKPHSIGAVARGIQRVLKQRTSNETRRDKSVKVG